MRCIASRWIASSHDWERIAPQPGRRPERGEAVRTDAGGDAALSGIALRVVATRRSGPATLRSAGQPQGVVVGHELAYSRLLELSARYQAHAPIFAGVRISVDPPGPRGLPRRQMTSPRAPQVSPSGPRARSWRHGRACTAGAQLVSSQNSRWSPRCGTTWSTTVAGTTRPWARQAAHSGCCARKAARARRQRGP